MRNSLLILLVLAFSGCATLPQEDRNVLHKHRVSSDLYDRMVNQEVLTLPDLMELAEKKVPEAFVLRYLRGTVAVYRLRSDDVVILRKAGVSSKVIDHLLATPTLYPQQLGDPFWYYDDDYWWGYPAPIVHRGHFSHRSHDHGHRHHHHHGHRHRH